MASPFHPLPIAYMLTLPLFDALEARDLSLAAALAATPGDDWDLTELHPQHQVTPLMMLVSSFAVPCTKPMEDEANFFNDVDPVAIFKLARALIAAGADPQQQAPASCQYFVRASKSVNPLEQDDDDGVWQPSTTMLNGSDWEEVPYYAKFECEVSAAGRSAHSLCLALKTKMEADFRRFETVMDEEGEPDHVDIWSPAADVLKALSEIFQKVMIFKQPASKVAVHEGVVAMWEKFRSDESSHDVRLLCKDQKVLTAHAQVLSLSSPVLAVMLTAPLLEGSSKCITIADSTPMAAQLFLDLLYTGSTEMEEDDATMRAALLGALALAHRWTVQPVVDMTERALTREIRPESFDEIATAAQQLSLPGLKSACRRYAADPKSGLHARLAAGARDPVPPAVRELLVPAAAAGGIVPPANKKRRSF